MSSIASVTFQFDGTHAGFKRVYDAICDLGLDIGAHFDGTSGTVEFAIGDFSAFTAEVAKRSTEIGLKLEAVDYLRSEKSERRETSLSSPPNHVVS